MCFCAKLGVISLNRFSKRVLAALLSLFIAAGSMTAALAADVKYGDADGNGAVNSSDALEVLFHATEKKLLTGDALVAADVNGDGNINSSDALEILFYSVEKIKSFSVENAVAFPKNNQEALKIYADALKKAMNAKPSYDFEMSTTVKDVDVDVSGALAFLLPLFGYSADELEEEFKSEMLKQNMHEQTFVKKGSVASLNNLPAECELTDASVLASVSYKSVQNGKLRIELRFKDEKNPEPGSPLGKALGIADYNSVLAGLQESAEEEEGANLTLNELSYKNCYIICEIDCLTGEFVNLEWNTDMFTDTSMSMSGIDVVAKMTNSINSVYTGFEY